MMHAEKSSEAVHGRQHDRGYIETKHPHVFKREAHEDGSEDEEPVAQDAPRIPTAVSRAIAMIIILLMSYRILYVWPAASNHEYEKRLPFEKRATRILKNSPLIGETSLGWNDQELC